MKDRYLDGLETKGLSVSDLSLDRDYTSKHLASQDLQSIKCELSCVIVTDDSV